MSPGPPEKNLGPTLGAAPVFSGALGTDQTKLSAVEKKWPGGSVITIKIMGVNTVDGRNSAPPKKPWNDDAPCQYQQTWVGLKHHLSAQFKVSSLSLQFEPP